MLSKEELYIFWGGEIIRYRMFFNHVYPFFSFHPYFLAYMIKYTQILYSFGTKHPPTFIFIIFLTNISTWKNLILHFNSLTKLHYYRNSRYWLNYICVVYSDPHAGVWFLVMENHSFNNSVSFLKIGRSRERYNIGIITTQLFSVILYFYYMQRNFISKLNYSILIMYSSRNIDFV